MTHTTNYELSQWQKPDRVLMADFNSDNEKLDTALKALADAVSTKAEASALSALTTTVSGKADTSALNALAATVSTKADASAVSALAIEHFSIGSFTGDGSATRTISLPFTPKILLVSGSKKVSSYTEGLFTLAFGSYSHRFFSGGNSAISSITIVDNGFRIDGDYHNDNGIEQRYIAIR